MLLCSFIMQMTFLYASKFDDVEIDISIGKFIIQWNDKVLHCILYINDVRLRKLRI